MSDRRIADRRVETVTRSEFETLAAIVERHRIELQIQFERIAQMQVILDRLSHGHPPRFKA
jgi:hypothetical protein